jgi:Tol biopolymer transport system component
MSLPAGTRLGPYEVLAPIGAGGMGEVYRARDSRLQREVAIKVLPELLAGDPERLARFTREAQTLAALNHPNIAQIHGLEESGGVQALVMELVEGEDLAQRIDHGPLPLDEALPIARQIADALEAAHESGIVHRDLKPANVRLRPDGTVKVLDFGLAKALEPTPSSAGIGALPNSPTITQHATQLGVILGSAGYMAPEQARGRAVDRRADIWAFGVVLYEMLTGRRAFEGEEITDVIAAVLKSEPDLGALPPDLPPAVHRVLRRCLEKDPRQRLSSIRDARLELDEREPAVADNAASAAAGSGEPRRSFASRLAPLVAVAVVAALGAALATRYALRTPAATAGPAPRLTRLSISAPPGKSLFADTSGVALSPDGRQIAFVVGTIVGTDNELWVRSLESTTARRIESADTVQFMFWSPDSRRIGFFTPDQFKIVAADGGRAQVLCNAEGGRGGDWNGADQILLAPAPEGPLFRISANGGDPVQVTTLDAARGESSHRFPTFLPDGDHFLFAALPARAGKFEIFASSLSDPGHRTQVGAMETAPRWVAPDWLLFARRGILTVQHFDPKTLRLSGDPLSLGDEPTAVFDPSVSVTAAFSAAASNTGTLAYFSSGWTNTRAMLLEESGREIGAVSVPAGQYTNVRVSPDGTQAILVRSLSPTESTLWQVDLARGSALPVSTGGGRNESPVWSPDGSGFVFASDREGAQNIYRKSAGDTSPETLLDKSPVLFENPDGWSPDGRWITLQRLDAVGKQNIWLLPASGDGKAELYVQGPARELNGNPSPDGRWLAYAAADTGRLEIYVQGFPKPARRVQVSRDGGVWSWWVPGGRGLLFMTETQPRAVWTADLLPGAGPEGPPRFSEPRLLATLPPGTLAVDALPDRRRFLALVPENSEPGSITVVQNWPAALSKAP